MKKKKKELQSLLALSVKLIKEKDSEIEELHTQLLASKTLPHIKEAVAEMDKLEKDKILLSKNVNTDSLISSVLFRTNHKEWAKRNVHPVFKKEVVDDSTTFSSRFMPNVKFKIADTNYRPSHIFNMIMAINKSKPIKSIYYSYETDKNGNIWNGHENFELFNAVSKKEVSIYEAKSGLVPKGMIYYPRADKLIEKICVNQLCSGEFCDCDDSESFMAYNRSETGTDYHPDDVAFKVTEDRKMTSEVHEFTRSDKLPNPTWERVNNGGNHIAPDGTAHDFISDVFDYMDKCEKEEKLIDGFGARLDARIKEDVFSVTEVVSICETCLSKANCSIGRILDDKPYISECAEYHKEPESPVDDSVELKKALTLVQKILWGTELPILRLTINSVPSIGRAITTDHTIFFTTIDNTKMP